MAELKKIHSYSSDRKSESTYKGDTGSEVTVVKTEKASRSSSHRFGRALKNGGRRSLRILSGISLDSPSANSIPIIPKLFLLFFAVSMLIFILYDSNLSFSTLLTRLESVEYPTFSQGWAGTFRDFLHINGDWSVLNPLRDFINNVTGLLSFIVSIVAGLVALMAFIAKFFGIFGL